MKISIIMPSYNREKLIEKTLDSILGQTFEHDNLEIILIDDGSSDNTVNIAQNKLIPANMPHIILKQTHKGVSAARNKGISVAKGEFIFFLDSDDTIAPDCLERLYIQATKEKADIVFCGFDMVNSTGEKILVPFLKQYKYLEHTKEGYEVLLLALQRKTWICTGSALYKRDLIIKNNLKYTVGCTLCEDSEFRFKCLFHAGRVSTVNESLAFYHQHENNSVKKNLTGRFHAVAAFQRLEHYFESMPYLQRKDCIEIIKTQVIPRQLISDLIFFAKNEYGRNIFFRTAQSKPIREKLKKLKFKSQYKKTWFYIRLFFLNANLFYHIVRFKN